MIFKKRNLLAATLAGSVLMGFGTGAQADATFDLINALVEKGVLTEEEALPLMKSRTNDEKIAAKKVEQSISKKLPIKISHGKKGFRFETEDGNFQTNL